MLVCSFSLWIYCTFLAENVSGRMPQECHHTCKLTKKEYHRSAVWELWVTQALFLHPSIFFPVNPNMEEKCTLLLFIVFFLIVFLSFPEGPSTLEKLHVYLCLRWCSLGIEKALLNVLIKLLSCPNINKIVPQIAFPVSGIKECLSPDLCLLSHANASDGSPWSAFVRWLAWLRMQSEPRNTQPRNILSCLAIHCIFGLATTWSN